MCNFIRSNGEQCKLARNKERCGKHPIIIDQEIIVVEDNIVDVVAEMPPQVSTPVVAEVDMPVPSVIEPVEASNMKVKEVQELEKSNVELVIADATVYMKNQTSNSELNNSIDEEKNEFFFENYIEPGLFIQYDVKDEMKQHPLGIGAVTDAVNAYLQASNVSIYPSIKPNHDAYAHGYRYCFYIQQGDKTWCHYYCKNKQAMKNMSLILSEVDVVQYCLDKKLYDRRLFRLCSSFTKVWFQTPANLWMLAGHMATKPHVDIHLMMRTYACLLKSSLARFDIQAATNDFMQHYEKGEPFFGLSETKMKQIASGRDSEGYKEWKAKYEPTLPLKEKININPDDVGFTDNCLLRVEKIARLNSVERDFVLEGINSVDAMLEEDWLDEYVAITNRPTLGYKRTWQEYIRYVQAIRFSSKKKAAALLAMTIDHYIILMGNSFLYRCGLDSDYTNDVLTQAKSNPLEEITMSYWCEDKNEYKSIKALKVYEQWKSLFHTYEEYANQWGDVPVSKFSTCVPFKGNQVDSVDDDVIEPFLTFMKEIIANNNEELYMWLIKWIAHIYKYPNARTRCALVLLSIEEGTGKGTFCDILTYLFGIHNIDQSGGSVKSLVSERSSHLVGKKFAMVQEMRENKGDYMGCMEPLKTFITDDYIAVRPLYANKMTVRNLVELIMTTNNENILKTSVEGRRFTVAKVSSERKQDNSYFRNLKERCQTQSFIDSFATYLMNVDVREGSIKALATEALADMAEASQDSIKAYWSDIANSTRKEIKSDPYFVVSDDSIMIARKCAYESYKEWCAKNNEIVFKNRKFQSDTAYVSVVVEHRTKDTRFWKVQFSSSNSG